MKTIAATTPESDSLQVLTLTPYYMVNNVGQKPISIREELPEAAPDAAGWFDWARSSVQVREVEEVAEEEKSWKVVHPGEVVAFWPNARNKNLQLKARCSIFVDLNHRPLDPIQSFIDIVGSKTVLTR